MFARLLCLMSAQETAVLVEMERELELSLREACSF